jgi:4-carboxymuconolactone decarboxylase
VSLRELDAPTAALVGMAAAIAAADAGAIEYCGRRFLREGGPAVWVDELLLQSTLMVGWPRALGAAAIWRPLAGPAQPLEDGSDYEMVGHWQARGESICKVIYAGSYERLRRNIAQLHPSLDAWMVTEGYGRTLGRPGLDLARRELLVVAQVAVQGAEPQLHSHLLGALRAGAAPAVLDEAIAVMMPFLGTEERRLLGTLRERIGTP